MEPVEIAKRFIINRQGKDYILYGGLLNAAHANGLNGITTELVQVASAANGEVTIAKATVYMGEGKTPYTGYGDVGPKESNPVARGAPIRMAETRAKARALRDAINASTYELEGESEDLPPAPLRITDGEPPKEGSLPVRSLGDIVREAKDRHPESIPNSSGSPRSGSPPSPTTAQATATTRGAPTAVAVSNPASTPSPNGATTSVSEPEREGVAAHDLEAEYRSRPGASRVPAPYDTDPEKLENAHNSWDELSERAVALGITVQQPEPNTWAHVSLMRAAWAKLNREVRAAMPAPGSVPVPPDGDDAPPPTGE